MEAVLPLDENYRRSLFCKLPGPQTAPPTPSSWCQHLPPRIQADPSTHSHTHTTHTHTHTPRSLVTEAATAPCWCYSSHLRLRVDSPRWNRAWREDLCHHKATSLHLSVLTRDFSFFRLHVQSGTPGWQRVWAGTGSSSRHRFSEALGDSEECVCPQVSQAGWTPSQWFLTCFKITDLSVKLIKTKTSFLGKIHFCTKLINMVSEGSQNP